VTSHNGICVFFYGGWLVKGVCIEE